MRFRNETCLWGIFSLYCFTSQARAEAPDAPRPMVEIDSRKAHLVVLKAPQNHYLVTSIHQMGESTFWGTTDTLHQLRAYASSSTGGPEAYTEVDALFIAHNLPSGKRLGLRWKKPENESMHAGEWQLHCGNDPCR